MTAPAPIKLTVDKCKALCRDFRLTAKPDGKKGCLHLQNNAEMCNLPSHFLCELVRYKRNAARKEEIGEAIRSATKLNMIEACPRAYALHYIHGIEPEGEAVWKRVGDAWGVARARLDVGADVDPMALRDDLLPVERAHVRAAIRLYRLAGGSPLIPYAVGSVTCEEEVLFQHGGVWWLGFADALSLNRSRIYEWKFARREYPMLAIARQAAIYFGGIPEAQDFTLCVMRKPGQRPGKNETDQAFENRIYADMQREPEKWMHHTTISRSQIDVDGILTQMATSLLTQEEAGRQSSYAPHYSSCFDCDYASICELFIGKTTDYLVELRKKNDARIG